MYFGENRRGARNYGDLVIAGLFFLVPFLLIAKEPDLGTAVTLVPVCFGIAYLAGLRLRLIAIVAIAAVLLAPRRVEGGAQGLPEITYQHVPRSGEGCARARDTSRSRPGSRSGPAASRAKGS